MRLIPAAACLFLLPGLAAAADAPPLRQISVTGSAEVLAVPDLATISAGVQTHSDKAAEALTENSKAMARVFAELEAHGVAKTDIQTSQISLDPVWQQPEDGQTEPPKVVGYEANNMVTIKVRAVDQLGAVIDSLGGAGANRIFGVSFDVADPRPLLDQARSKAVEDAKAKAELLAKAAGVTLGPVQSIQESGGGGSPAPLRAKAEMAMAAPVAEGQVTLGADVALVFGIE
ncbi:MAG: SIMPL domain-containing protein [Amaricoccus sp.]